MMRRVLLAAAIIAFMAAPAHAAKNGKYLQNCPLANTGQVDPLVSPGALRPLDAAFFTMNGVISVSFFAFVLADVLVS